MSLEQTLRNGNRRGDPASAPRCSAHSKRTGLACGQPAVRGFRVCRFHGARGGAPRCERNGRWIHGMCGWESRAVFRFAKAKARRMVRLARLMDDIRLGVAGP